MKYMLQVRFNGADAVIHELPADEQEKITAEFIAIRKSSGVLDGNQLEAASAESLSRRCRTDDAGDPGARRRCRIRAQRLLHLRRTRHHAAIAFAARIPVARIGGSIEVRATGGALAMADFPTPKTGSSSRTSSSPPTSHASRHFYADVLGGEVLLEGEPTIIALANSWVIINVGGRTD